MMEEETMNGKTPKISGKDKNSSKKTLGTLQKYMNDQKSSNILKPKALNSAPWDGMQNPDLPDTMASQLKSQDSDEVVSNCGSLECSSSSSRKIVSPEFHDHYYKTESKKLLGATDDMVMSLLHMDYSGRPHCKPPINNRQPSLNSVKP
ncbi:uncharacterized protein LOC122064614 [Macadamia integrifolia]|uniref:uncharacterized protein LOC122064614 n=1 Tax=Macadamia integrifolia TaxID=60698 RepID=UPI001C500C27|nr:uncharacterized protein LOC122064614 [Macadamia integrifolia]